MQPWDHLIYLPFNTHASLAPSLSTVWKFGIMGQWKLCLANLIQPQSKGMPSKEKLTHTKKQFLLHRQHLLSAEWGYEWIRNGKSITKSTVQRLKKDGRENKWDLSRTDYQQLSLKSQSRIKGRGEKMVKAETTTRSSDFLKSKERGIPAKLKLETIKSASEHLCSRKERINSFHWSFNSFITHQKEQKIWNLFVSRMYRLS